MASVVATSLRAGGGRRGGERGVTAWVLGAMFGAAACADVRFEEAPYVARDLRVVYSEQEDLTFLFWSLPRAADLDAVAFTLFDGAPLNLDEAPYPAPPRSCAVDRWCFQFQLDGRVDPPAEPLLTTHHPRFGAYPSRVAELETAVETFGLAPIAVDRNRAIETRRQDWFADQGIPLVRDYAYHLDESDCGGAGGAGVPLDPVEGPIRETVAAPPDWESLGLACLRGQPNRRDRPGVVLSRPLVPSAVTWLLPRDRFEADTTQHQTLVWLWFDLAVPDASRCARVREELTAAIDGPLLAQDPRRTLIGIFDSAIDGSCSPSPPPTYPVAEMVEATGEALRAAEDPALTVVWIYVSNRLAVPPAFPAAWESLRSATLDLVSRATTPPSAPPYFWAVAGPELSFALRTAPDVQVLYRPLEDETLFEDLTTEARRNVPFRTMLHEPSARIPVAAPPDDLGPQIGPRIGRLCDAFPPVTTLLVGDRAVDAAAFAWPARSTASFQADLGVQRGVPAAAYEARGVTVQLELCTAFCDGPLVLADGTIIESWGADTRCGGWL